MSFSTGRTRTRVAHGAPPLLPELEARIQLARAEARARPEPPPVLPGLAPRPAPAAAPRPAPAAPAGTIQVVLTVLGIALTLIAAGFIAFDLTRGLFAGLRSVDAWRIVSISSFGLAIVALIYGSLAYQVSRVGFLLRRMRHRPVANRVLDDLCARPDVPSVTVLVPSYKEAPEAVRQTLLSAALQDYPNKQVVLLIDDPPDPSSAADVHLLDAVRRTPRDLQALLAARRERYERMFADLLATQPFDGEREARRLAQAYGDAASWFEQQAREHDARDHTDALFVRIVFTQPAAELRDRARRFALRHTVDFVEAVRAYQRLERRFSARIASFERKRFVNLSHEPNKAMNLNSYLSLLGRALKFVRRPDGVHCVDATDGDAELLVSRPDYVVTLDADSLLAHDYVLRLVEILERPGNERLAVAQTPYSAVSGASSAIERIAGATTDIQYVMQQGSTWQHGTYWVGANAVLRTGALEDIATVSRERGVPVVRYIQDRTLIEDAESTIDVISHGWSLYNYPERLAYSATPPDFGSLIIQRRRWANGGLLILPKLLRHLWSTPKTPRLVGEAFLRLHYVLSEASVNVALVLVFAAPFADGLFTWWLFASAVPYFALFAHDLSREGYKHSDIVRVYALNLLLVPVNLAGVINSLRQAVTGRKVPFGRTPKVQGRTAAPGIYIVTEVALVALIVLAGAVEAVTGHWLYAAFAAVNGCFLAYACVTYIGLRNGWQDVLLALPRPEPPAQSASELLTQPAADPE